MTRREKLEAMLLESPDDSFLRYGIAMEDRSAGNGAAALAGFLDVLSRDPAYVPAYFQAAQLEIDEGRTVEARDLLEQGIAAARKAGDSHAMGEMQNVLQALPG